MQHEFTTETGENKVMKKKEKMYSSSSDEDPVLIMLSREYTHPLHKVGIEREEMERYHGQFQSDVCGTVYTVNMCLICQRTLDAESS